VSVSTAARYDRFELELDGPMPSYTLTRQSNAVFTQDASGFQIRVEGTAGVLVRLEIADSHTRYTGPRDLTPRSPLLREARLVSDFEGVVMWGLGLARPACLRVQTLLGPSRLVVDLAQGP
jgi:hypothetical protein